MSPKGKAVLFGFSCYKQALTNETDNDNSTPIMFAARHGYNDIVRWLLEKGADPTFVGKHGLSTIGFARQNNLIGTEKILLGHK